MDHWEKLNETSLHVKRRFSQLLKYGRYCYADYPDAKEFVKILK